MQKIQTKRNLKNPETNPEQSEKPKKGNPEKKREIRKL